MGKMTQNFETTGRTFHRLKKKKDFFQVLFFKEKFFFPKRISSFQSP